MAGPRCVPTTWLPTSPCFAANAHCDSGALLPRPGICSDLPNHCVSFELTLSLASLLNSSAVFGFWALMRCITRAISSRAMSRARSSANCCDSIGFTSSKER